MSTPFRAFGQLAVRPDQLEGQLEGRVTLRRCRERDLLALLIAAQGQPLPADRVLLELWGPDGPCSGTARVQVAVSRLRSLLDPTRAGISGVRTTPAGYQLSVGRDAVDVWVFEDAAEQALAASSPGRRLALTTRALAHWSGDPYADCTPPLVRAEAARLDELHLSVQASRAEAMLTVGESAAAVRALAQLVPAHPYREDLWALLARAQYACARQADALATLATLRRRLDVDLGVAPSPAIRMLETQILQQDAALTPVTRPDGHRQDQHDAMRVRRHHRARVGRCAASSVTLGGRAAV